MNTIVQENINSQKLRNLESSELSKYFLERCYDKNWESIKSILEDSELREKLSFESINYGFMCACQNNQLELVKFLSSYLSEKNSIKQAFRNSCSWNCIEIIDYLANSPKYNEYIDQDTINEGFQLACHHDNVEAAEYLLNSTNIKCNADIHSSNDQGFVNALENECTKVIQYLVFNMDIKKTKIIQNYLINFPNQEVENMFKIRDLNQSLEKELSSDNINNIKKAKL